MGKGYIYSDQKTLFGGGDVVGFGVNDFYIQVIDRDIANDIIVNNHYSKKYFNNSYIHLGIFLNNEMVGVLQYGFSMNASSAKNIVPNTKAENHLELNRMWIDDKAGRNTESRAISYSIKFIKKAHPAVWWIQSFADERCGCWGIVYQASNFGYYGEHKSVFWELDGVTYHNISASAKRDKAGDSGIYLQDNIDRATRHTFRQFRYLYFIKQKYKKDCLLKEQPYPKYYDVSNG